VRGGQLVTVQKQVGGAARSQRVANRCDMTAAKSAARHFGPNDGRGVRQRSAGG
jgi:hypothetical protein